jgi:SOS-response transcriptional repressor LexA
MTENRKLKVFLCHSSEDKPKVRKLYRRLVSDGFDAWLDEEKLIPGHNWDYEIRKAMQETDVVIICLSNNAVNKAGYVQKEIRQAIDKANEQPEGKVYLIPLKLEDCKVPASINQYQWVDLFSRTGYQQLRTTLEFCVDDRRLRYSAYDLKVINRERVLIRIPILGPISTELPLLESEVEVSGEEFVEVAVELLPRLKSFDNLFALEVKGNSMNDALIYDGDFVILKATNKVKNGEMAAIWMPLTNEAMLKYYFEERARYMLISSKPSMKPVYVPKSEPLEVKGKVVMVIRRIQ